MSTAPLYAPAPAVAGLERALLERYAPPPRLAVGEWLDAHRTLGRGESPMPGPWRTARTPYLREPLDAQVDPAVETIVALFSSQIGKTEWLLGSMLYAYGVDPGPGMLVLPTLELAGGVSTDRVTPALRGCDVLAGKVGVAASRATDNAILHKRINGAPLTLCGANSPASLSSRPVRYLWCDEIDRWPATTPEGDPLSLAFQRTAAYRRRKVMLSSTPTTRGASRIEDWYERSDKRVYDTPCPKCGEFFVVEWADVRWETGDPASAHIECPRCHGRIEESEREAMVGAGRWRATAPEVTRLRGYKVWAVVSPWVRLEEMVRGFLAAKEKVETLRAWVNLTRGESWEEATDKVESSALIMRRERYAEEVPARVEIVTAGVDTQDDRLEALVVGWAAGEESWVIARETVPVDPKDPQAWKELDELLLLRAWPREGGGTHRVQAALVDCLGHRTSYVYQAVRARQGRRVYASVGKSGGQNGQLVSPPKSITTPQGNVLRVVVDSDQVKSLIYSRLRLEAEAGPEVVHFPMTVGDAFFSELTAEHLVTERNRYGVPARHWAKLPGRERNEALDCFGLALAALRLVAPTPARFAELSAKIAAARGAEAPARGQAPAGPRPPRPPRTQGWTGGL